MFVSHDVPSGWYRCKHLDQLDQLDRLDLDQLDPDVRPGTVKLLLREGTWWIFSAKPVATCVPLWQDVALSSKR